MKSGFSKSSMERNGERKGRERERERERERYHLACSTAAAVTIVKSTVVGCSLHCTKYSPHCPH